LGNRTVFKSFPLYFGAALGAILYDDRREKELALAGARSLAAMYNPALKLVPLGSQAEDGGHIGDIDTSIDSLHAAPFLFWAARAAGDEKMREVAYAHGAGEVPSGGRGYDHGRLSAGDVGVR
jgi:unsaturated chondroitin disaccharide hydrolase